MEDVLHVDMDVGDYDGLEGDVLAQLQNDRFSGHHSSRWWLQLAVNPSESTENKDFPAGWLCSISCLSALLELTAIDCNLNCVSAIPRSWISTTPAGEVAPICAAASWCLKSGYGCVCCWFVGLIVVIQLPVIGFWKCISGNFTRLAFVGAVDRISFRSFSINISLSLSVGIHRNWLKFDTSLTAATIIRFLVFRVENLQTFTDWNTLSENRVRFPLK